MARVSSLVAATHMCTLPHSPHLHLARAHARRPAAKPQATRKTYLKGMLADEPEWQNLKYDRHLALKELVTTLNPVLYAGRYGFQAVVTHAAR